MKIIKTSKADLENKRALFLEIGFIVALLLVLGAFEYRSFVSYDGLDPQLQPNTEVIELPPVTEHKKEEPKKPPVVVRNLNLVDNSEDNIEDYLIDVHIDDDEPMDDIPDVSFEPETSVPDDHPYRIVQHQAAFKGGMPALYEFLRQNLVYPTLAKEVHTQGTVYIEFIVEKDGSITDVKLKRGIGSGCDEEAIRVVKMMPPWNPASQSGRNVRQIMTLPVKFSLR